MTVWLDFFMAICLVAVLMFINVAAGCEPEDGKVFLAIAVAVFAVAVTFALAVWLVGSCSAWLDQEFPQTTWGQLWDELEEVKD